MYTIFGSTRICALRSQRVKDDFQSVLRSPRTLMFINIINGSLDGMRIIVILKNHIPYL